jgi:hypothetical protein
MRILLIFILLITAGCAATKSIPYLDSDLTKKGRYLLSTNAPIASAEVQKVNVKLFPEGTSCTSPLLFIVSFGIIPAHCVDRYKVTNSENSNEYSGEYVVTRVSGWVALILGLFPSWEFAADKTEDRILWTTINAHAKDT